jgi:hypothetical protein
MTKHTTASEIVVRALNEAAYKTRNMKHAVRRAARLLDMQGIGVDMEKVEVVEANIAVAASELQSMADRYEDEANKI